ncbi:MAG: CARDB domain-containing protein, partial [Acidobacteriota bacterium]|nr:CARDB domain-containing protein [Acidobacteriota bacterium]
MKHIRTHQALGYFLAIIIGIPLGLFTLGQPGMTQRLAAHADSLQQEIAVDDSGVVEYDDQLSVADGELDAVASVAQTTELSVDDGSFETSLGLNSPGTTYFVNRLRPPSYPATLSQIRIFWRSAQGISVNLPVTLLVGTNPDGDENINGTTFQQTNATIQSLGSFNNYSVPSVTINSGDFVVGFRVQFNSPTFAGATDTSPTSNRRSYFSTDPAGATFTLTETIPNIGGGNLGIRAIVTVQQQPSGGVDALVASYIDPNRGDNGTGDLTSILNIATTPTIGSSIATQGNNAEVVIAPNGQYAIAYPTGAGDSVTIINNLQSNPAQGQTIQTGNTPNAVVITPDSSTAIVFNALSSPVTYRIIQGLPSSPAVSGTFSITGANNTVAEDAAISPAGTTVLVSLFNSNRVVILGGFPGAPTLRGTIDTDQGPNGIAFTPDGNTAFVANTLGNSIEVISGLLPGNVPFGANRVFTGVGPNPQAIALTPDGTKALVTNTGGNTVSVFQVSGTNLTLLQNLTVGQSPAGLSISSDGQIALVANAGSNTVSVIRGLNTPNPFVAQTLGPAQSLDTATFAERSVALVPSGAPPPPPQAPDFVVENLSISPTSAAPGANVTVNFTIRNQGNATAGSATHTIVLSPDNNITTGDQLLLSVATPALAAGAAQAFSQTVTIPGSAAAGTQFIGVIADAPNAVAESNEGNNTAATPITIVALQPDLIVQNLSVSPTTVTAGSNVTVSFTIRNQGSASAASTSHNIVLSVDNVITGADQVLLSVATPVLAAGAQQAFT